MQKKIGKSRGLRKLAFVATTVSLGIALMTASLPSYGTGEGGITEDYAEGSGEGQGCYDYSYSPCASVVTVQSGSGTVTADSETHARALLSAMGIPLSVSVTNNLNGTFNYSWSQTTTSPSDPARICSFVRNGFPSTCSSFKCDYIPYGLRRCVLRGS